ncbi:MAG: hypothetical protein K6B74_03380 [Ruminococcus sp.]|nr:hypothetical protein [Ruminococcus sp.]
MKNMVFSTSFIVTVIAVLLICAGIFALYMVLYRRRLNAALTAGAGSGRRHWNAPPWVMLVVLIFFGGSIIGISTMTHMMFNDITEGGTLGGGPDGGGSFGGPSIDIGQLKFRSYRGSDVKDTLIGESAPEGELKGYARFEETNGDFRFVYYANRSSSIMPPLLIYAEYIGSEKFDYSDSVLHVDNTDWSGEVFDVGGWLAEEKGSWYSVENFYTTGSMELRLYVNKDSTVDNTPDGTLYIDMDTAYNIQRDENGDAYCTEEFSTSTAE